MNVRLAGAAALVAAATVTSALAQAGATPTTLATIAFDSEGLGLDPDTGTMYTAESPDASGECVVHALTLSGALSFVGVVPKPSGPCAPRGLEFRNGRIYIADQGTGANGWVFEMDPGTGAATTFASGVAGANGIAFDDRGNLWITDGLRGLGRVYRRDAASGAISEMFRVPPVSNGTLNGGLVSFPSTSGVGRQYINVPVGMQPEVKAVANGIAVVAANGALTPSAEAGQPQGATVYVADTARGAIWAVRLDRHRDLVPGQIGCDPTLQDDTLCDSAVFVAHPVLEGADGMSVDTDGSLVVAANARQALVRVDRWSNVTELFRNPVNAQLLRSSADTADGNRHILEYPTNPVLVPGGPGRPPTLCVTSIDRPGRDNWPGTVGEIGGPGQPKGKVSCF